jgi:hypothetical protein
MDPYKAWLREVLQLAGEIYLRRVEAELWKFAEALDQWLHELFAHPRPDWRESFDQFLAQQEAEGRRIEPKSRQELLDFLEGWAARIDATASTSQPPVAAPKKPAQRRRVGRQYQRKSIQQEIREAYFNSKLAEANRHLDEIGRVLEALGQALDGAKPDELVQVDSDINSIETLIWRHNDALESARAAWLQDDLGSSVFDRLMLMSSPAAIGLPMFTDEQQADRARTQMEADRQTA